LVEAAGESLRFVFGAAEALFGDGTIVFDAGRTADEAVGTVFTGSAPRACKARPSRTAIVARLVLMMNEPPLKGNEK
jgi:hypothetical protein